MADASLLEDLRARISALESGKGSESEPLPSEERSANRTTHNDRSTPAGKGEGGRSAFDKIIGLVNASDKSELALRTRLEREGFEDADIEQAIAKAKDYGFIDDERFGHLLIESRLRQGWGSIGIERDLRKNGIDPSLLPGWPESFDISYESEMERALALLERKPPRTKNLREGAYRKAVQKGFPSAVAASAARLWCEKQMR